MPQFEGVRRPGIEGVGFSETQVLCTKPDGCHIVEQGSTVHQAHRRVRWQRRKNCGHQMDASVGQRTSTDGVDWSNLSCTV